MDIEVQPRPCANPGCRNLVPPAKPGHRAKLTCSDRCRKVLSWARKLAEARRQEEEARRARLERWQARLAKGAHLASVLTPWHTCAFPSSFI